MCKFSKSENLVLWITIGPGQADGDHPEAAAYFTAPLVMPEMIRRWATAKTTTSGRLIRIT